MFAREPQAQVLCLYFFKSWFWNAFEKQKQNKKQRPSLIDTLNFKRVFIIWRLYLNKNCSKPHCGKRFSIFKISIWRESFKDLWILSILFSNKKKPITAISNMDEFYKHCNEGEKMDPEVYILYDSTYMKSGAFKTNLWWLN